MELNEMNYRRSTVGLKASAFLPLKFFFIFPFLTFRSRISRRLTRLTANRGASTEKKTRRESSMKIELMFCHRYARVSKAVNVSQASTPTKPRGRLEDGGYDDDDEKPNLCQLLCFCFIFLFTSRLHAIERTNEQKPKKQTAKTTTTSTTNIMN